MTLPWLPNAPADLGQGFHHSDRKAARGEEAQGGRCHRLPGREEPVVALGGLGGSVCSQKSASTPGSVHAWTLLSLLIKIR